MKRKGLWIHYEVKLLFKYKLKCNCIQKSKLKSEIANSRDIFIYTVQSNVVAGMSLSIYFNLIFQI